ncbi:hypothetical protein L2712_07300 [Shewanella marisflavi]|uniref:hypothetical protein n=1 Tax=Shewanella marisflavi TaxID=260364 RepID=UPI00200F9FD0|nr:hypothetical protein [Shewanella marisflavi]MCL1041443.1 hypothetical protein [Shewanella marisflavi]
MHTRLKTPYRPDRLLIYAMLMATALVLLLMPYSQVTWHAAPLPLFSLLLLLSCAVTLLAIARRSRVHRTALTLLFSIWLLVWFNQGLLLPLSFRSG